MKPPANPATKIAGAYLQNMNKIILTSILIIILFSTVCYSWERRCGTSGSGSNTNSCIQSVCAVNNRCRIVIYGNVRALKHYSLSATISSNRSIPASDSKSVSIAD